jgi:hypothetical protein
MPLTELQKKNNEAAIKELEAERDALIKYSSMGYLTLYDAISEASYQIEKIEAENETS